MATKEEIEKFAEALEKQRQELGKERQEWERYKSDLLEREKVITDEHNKLEAAKQLANLGETSQQPQTTHTTVVKGTIGSIAEFTLDEDWAMWYERVEQYVLANEVHASKHVSLFLTLLGKEDYALLRNLCTPHVPAQLPLATLANTMKDHLQPAPSIIRERYKFKECKQQVGEDVKRYVANLKRLSTFCEFGNNLENSIRDQFVWGLASESIKKKLLGEKDLTYHRAVEMALSMEAAGRDAAKMNATTTTPKADDINFVAFKKGQTSKHASARDGDNRKCFCCGRTNHIATDCKYKGYKCNKCGKVGHLQNMCKNKKVFKGGGKNQRQSVTSQQS